MRAIYKTFSSVSLCLCVIFFALPAQGQVTITLDNDILALRGRGAPADYDYTHGLTVAVKTDSARRFLVGQRIYTPRRDAPEPVPGERPYAAWLFAGAQIARGERTAAVEIGITGPAALGEPVQNGVHRLLGSERQEGWEHQLGFEPGILLRLQEARRWDWGPAQIRPEVSIALGNVRTAADAGAHAAVGRGRGPYARIGARREWVLRDLFLDGNTFRSRSSARKLPFVSEGEAAAGFRARRWSAEYRFVSRSREYRAQPEGHAYGSLVLTLRANEFAATTTRSPPARTGPPARTETP
jgi:hypothetical protein